MTKSTTFEERLNIAILAPEFEFHQYSDKDLCVYPKSNRDIFCEFDNGEPVYRICSNGLAEVPIDTDVLEHLIEFCSLLGGING